MAFGNKKKQDDAPAAVAEMDGARDDTEAVDDAVDAPLFGADATADEEGASPEAGLEPVTVVEPAPPAADATDALLSMFQSSEKGTSDRTVVLDLAGDVELADLIEDLQTLSSALGIVRA